MDEAQRNTIYLDIDDDITAIIGKIEAASKDRVRLVVPKRSTVLQSAVNMKLLKKAAKTAGKDMALITEEPAINKIAARLEIKTAPSLREEAAIPTVAEDTPKGLPSDVIEGVALTEVAATDKAASEPEAANTADSMEPTEPPASGRQGPQTSKAAAATAAIKKRIPDFDRFKKRLLVGVVGLVGLIFIIWLAFFNLPRAKVIIEAQTEPLASNFDFTADTQAQSPNYDVGVLPATSHDITKTLAKDFPTTGKKDLGTKATGKVTIENCESGPGSQSYSAGIKFVSGAGKIYAADAGFEVPGATVSGGGVVCGTSDPIAVTAAANGSGYNADAGPYTSSSFAGAYNISGTKMEGGTSKIAKVASKTDIADAKKELLTEARADAKKTLGAQFAQDEYRVEASYKETVQQQTSDPAEGAESDGTARLTIKVKYSQLGVKKGELVELFKHNDLAQADQQGKTALGVVKEGLDEATITKKDQTGSAATFHVKTTALLGPDIDFAQLKEQLGGKRFSAAVDTIKALPGVLGADVKFSPFWVRKIPRDPAKVTIEIKLP